MKKRIYLGFIMFTLALLTSCDGPFESSYITVTEEDITVEVFTDQVALEDSIDFSGQEELEQVYDSLTFDDSSLNFDVTGTYDVPYTYTDLNGDSQTGSITVYVVDTVSPELTLNGSARIEREQFTPYLDEGVTVTDNYDEDVTIETTSTYNPLVPGDYQITYLATDESGNTAELTRFITVLSKEFIFEVHTEEIIFFEPAMIDESPISVYYDSLSFSYEELNASILGDYTVSFTYNNPSGESMTSSLLVHIVDTTPPVLTLNGDDIISHAFRDVYIDEGCIGTDNYDEEVTIEKISTYNPFMIGQYQTTYIARDSSGNVTEVTRTISVEEITHTSSPYGLKYPDGMEFLSKTIEVDEDFLLIGSGLSKGIIKRINDQAEELWTVYITHEGYADVWINDAIINTDNQLVVVGMKVLDNGRAGFIATYDLDGHQLSYQEEDPVEMISYEGVRQLSDGNYLLITSENYTLMRAIKTSPSFEQIWDYEIDGEKWFQDIKEHDDGSITIYAQVSWSSQLHTYTIDQNGQELLWSYANANGRIWDVFVEEERHILVASEGLTIVSETNTISQEITVNEQTVYPLSMTSFLEGGYILVGYIDSELNDSEAIIIELDQNFNVVASITLEGSQYDVLSHIFIDSSGLMLAAGSSSSNDGDFTNREQAWDSLFLFLIPESIASFSEEDTTPPTMQLNGYNMVNIELGSDYIELGASAFDEEEELEVTILGSVDTSKEGIYELYYLAIDEAGNQNILRRSIHVYEELDEQSEYLIDLYPLLNEQEDLFYAIEYYDQNEDNYLSALEIMEIEYLNMSNKNIKDLKYIQLLTSLTYLRISSSNLTTLEGIEYLLNLEEIDFAFNKLNSISGLEYLTKLTNINLANNYIEDVSPIASLTNLSTLTMTENPVNDLDALGNLPNLRELYLSGITATTFNNVSRFPLLEKLLVTGDQLVDVNGFNNPNLTFVSVFNAALTNLDGFTGLEHSPLLTSFSAGQNNLTDVCGLSNATSIEELNIVNNNLTDISCLDTLTKLTYISIVNTQIDDISVFSNFPLLEEINLGAGDFNFTYLLDLDQLHTLYYHHEYNDLSIDSDNRISLEQLIDLGVEVHTNNVIHFNRMDDQLKPILDGFDLDNSNGLDLLEARSVTNLDLSNIGLYSLLGLDYFTNLQSITINTNNLDLSTGSNNQLIVESLEEYGVIVTLVD